MANRERPYEKDLRGLELALQDIFGKRIKFANSKPEVFYIEGDGAYIKCLEAMVAIIEKAGLLLWRGIARARGARAKLSQDAISRLDSFILGEVENLLTRENHSA